MRWNDGIVGNVKAVQVALHLRRNIAALHAVRVDATTEAEIALQQQVDEEEAMRDMGRYARRVRWRLGLLQTELARRIDFGPGYRVYFGRDGDTLIVLLGGGTKKRQQQDIESARGYWRDFRSRKRKELERCH